ncbi:hypothetical protein [Paenibacillus alba]|uniref:Uncharacterized protein n=1 Tax=Paenibacillus alba TaxID=1197127 RepID=A0ABU6GB38_9BACL|nr:hypothetical protein [Paenibacillus alba]MEC0231411.1 hypothetical protein [Paenibacillus alba]
MFSFVSKEGGKYETTRYEEKVIDRTYHGYDVYDDGILPIRGCGCSTNGDITPIAPAGTDPTDWVFATVPNANPTLNPIQLNRGDTKYIYVPAKSAVDGSNVEIVSFTATMITANGKMISVDVYPDAAK